MVSDNEPQLTSDLMKEFMTRNGVKQIFIASYHQASNGAAEGLVGKFKAAMKRMIVKNSDSMFNELSQLEVKIRCSDTTTR